MASRETVQTAGRDQSPLTVLAVGAHPDDVEIGAGGTLAAHRAAGHRVVMLVLTLGQAGPAGKKTRKTEQQRAADVLGAELVQGPFIDTDLGPMNLVISYLEEVIASLQPDLIYTHSEEDSHQDHRITHSAVISAGRDRPTILLWPSPTTHTFRARVFVDIGPHMATKMRALRSHASQVEGSARVNLSAIEGAARFRGGQIGVEFAEVFDPWRVVLSAAPQGPDFVWGRLPAQAGFLHEPIRQVAELLQGRHPERP